MIRVLFLFFAIHAYAAFNLTWAVPAVSLDSNPPMGDTDVSPAIVVDSLGNACATWGRTAGGNSVQEIWAAVYNHSSRTWTGAFKISGGSQAANSQVVMDKFGNALFVWEEGFPSRIVCRSLNVSGVWEPALSLPPLRIYKSTNSQTLPKIAMNENGHAVVIWTESISDVYQVCGACKRPDQSWTGVAKVSSSVHGVPFTGKKEVLIDASGSCVAVWEDTDRIFLAQRVGEAWNSPIAVSGAFAKNPSLTMNKAGSAWIAWEQESQIFSKRFENGILGEQSTISDALYKCQRPCVRMDEMGNAVIVFERHDSFHKFIAGASFPRGQTDWSLPTDISAPSELYAKEAGFPVLALNEIGDGVVIWKQFDGQSMMVEGAGYSLGTWSLPKTLSALGSHAAERFAERDIDVSLNLAGNILAVWPEDPTGQGAQQIKATAGAGLANAAPFPPIPHPLTVMEGITSGSQVLHRFPAHADLINILTWSTNIPGASYNVYRGNLSTLIGTTDKMYFEDHQRIPKQKETYLITVLDENGQESSPMTIVVHPK